MTAIAVVSISARMLAESAVADGFEVVALDLFGDTDTRRACAEWHSLGDPASLSVDGARLLSALQALAQRGRVAGWIAGSGFEGRPDLLESGATLMPLIGTQGDAMRRVREPKTFFSFLDSRGIVHPEVRMTAPEDAAGWLVKDAHGCGGWHISRAASQRGRAPPDDALSAHHYFQRETSGTPMSATFIANGGDASLLGFNELIVRPLAGRPFVFCGSVGPVQLPDIVGAQVTAALRALVAAFSLRGLGSLDFMLDVDTVNVLEVNPRPPASMALYGRGIVAAHVRACVQGDLPSRPAQAASDLVRGNEVVFAPRRLWLDEPASQRLAARAGCHDLPAAASGFEAGDPLCSVSASGTNAGQVRELLQLGRMAVHQSLESSV
ncbi:ATP-grasp domain-containing protein [Variovorax sp. J22P240]|uniref:ATP-grasp domain-containing protein n=1 Tax=Variovorax sp. J22P240 TaxID=3053514 RepID=UPI0025775B00|nr:ATP-grasp domain-containing protein [Variovorax sp. J22P240]MDL9997889.1 ATP-grasp domain-containing protein [Variovorax sp. J22P240]